MAELMARSFLRAPGKSTGSTWPFSKRGLPFSTTQPAIPSPRGMRASCVRWASLPKEALVLRVPIFRLTSMIDDWWALKMPTISRTMVSRISSRLCCMLMVVVTCSREPMVFKFWPKRPVDVFSVKSCLETVSSLRW